MSDPTPSITKGQTVFTLDDRELGRVTDVHGNYFTVSRGLLHSKLYVTLEDLHDMRGDRVIVNAVADEVEMKNWDVPPRDFDAQ